MCIVEYLNKRADFKLLNKPSVFDLLPVETCKSQVGIWNGQVLSFLANIDNFHYLDVV